MNNFQNRETYDPEASSRLTLNFSQETYLRLLAMQFAMSAESKEDVVVQSFAILEWLIDVAKAYPGASYLLFDENNQVITTDKLRTLFDTKGGQ